MTTSITTPDGVSIIPSDDTGAVSSTRSILDSKATGFIVATIALAIVLAAFTFWPVVVFLAVKERVVDVPIPTQELNHIEDFA